MNNVTSVVINWLTAERTLHAVQSYLTVYPDIPLIIVDDDSNPKDEGLFFSTYNGHGYNPSIEFDPNTDKLKNIPGTTFIQVPPHNLHPKGHGNAMDFAAEQIDTRWMFMFHSDYRFLERGVIEELLDGTDELYCGAGDNKTRSKMTGLNDVNVLYNLQLGKMYNLSFKPVIYYENGTTLPFPEPEGSVTPPGGIAIENGHYYIGKLVEMGFKIHWVSNPHGKYGVHLRWQEGDNSEWEKYY